MGSTLEIYRGHLLANGTTEFGDFYVLRMNSVGFERGAIVE
jgi:hypothetical protein